ncbi:MAG TPA: 30S ribosomal protein S6 [Saprospiraceae bacterium]|nr:30S ribosomal protein S6 [Saprospiraceae bacterium]
MQQYEVTFIVDPVLSGDEIKSTAQGYVDLLKNEQSEIVHFDEMGLKPLAYPINKRSSGIYFCIEFSSPVHTVIPKLELALKRDERVMRFLSIKLDKYGVKYNEDKRNGLIGRKKSFKAKAKPVVAPLAPVVPPAPVAAIQEEE